MVLTVFKMDASPPSRAVLMTIEALQIRDVDLVEVNVLKGDHLKEDYLKVNPNHSIPFLKDDDFVILDSHAIATYLVTKYGADDSLYPVDPKKRAAVDQRLYFNSGVLFPAGQATVAPIFFEGEKELRLEGLEKIKKAYQSMEKFLAGSDWLAGDSVTLADICAVATISSLNMAMLEIDSVTYPKLAAWLDRVSQQDFYKKANEPGLKQFTANLKLKMQ